MVSYVVDACISCGYHATVVQSLLNTVGITKIKVEILKNKKIKNKTFGPNTLP